MKSPGIRTVKYFSQQSIIMVGYDESKDTQTFTVVDPTKKDYAKWLVGILVLLSAIAAVLLLK